MKDDLEALRVSDGSKIQKKKKRLGSDFVKCSFPSINTVQKRNCSWRCHQSPTGCKGDAFPTMPCNCGSVDLHLPVNTLFSEVGFAFIVGSERPTTLMQLQQDSLKVLCDQARLDHPLAVEMVDADR